MIEILEPGLLTTVQDAVGRPGWRHLGVPEGGAADPWSARLANRLVGAPDDAPLLEILLGGLVLSVDRPTVAALAGRLARAGGVELPAGEAWTLRPGSHLRVEPGDGARGYLALGGGLEVPTALGSASTELRTGFGGHEGRALRAGDRLDIRPGGTRHRWTGRREDGPLRILPGPHPDGFDALLGEWTVGAEADRTGVRLDGRTLEGGEVPSMGLPVGAIQVPPDGRPIVMLADRPVTGGYRVPATVIRADVGRVAQARTGDVLRFASVSVEEARAAWTAAEAELARVDALTEEDDPAWAGAHR